MEQNAGSAFITTKQGAKIFYKDWGKGDVILLSHGWPLSSDAWDGQMIFLLEKGYRVIAHDRRGFGRSTQTWDNNTMDQFADDLNELITQLDLKDIVLVGHSMGGGEVVRYAGRYGVSRLKKVVLVGAVPPIMMKTERNPDGLPRDVFDNIRRNVMDNRAQFFQDFPKSFYGYNRMLHKDSPGMRESFWRQSMMAGIKATHDCVKAFSETDFTEDLKKITVPALVIHGDDDQIVPIDITSKKTATLLPSGKLKIYKGGGHGIPQVQQDEFNEDLLNFIKS